MQAMIAQRQLTVPPLYGRTRTRKPTRYFPAPTFRSSPPAHRIRTRRLTGCCHTTLRQSTQLLPTCRSLHLTDDAMQVLPTDQLLYPPPRLRSPPRQRRRFRTHPEKDTAATKPRNIRRT